VTSVQCSLFSTTTTVSTAVVELYNRALQLRPSKLFQASAEARVVVQLREVLVARVEGACMPYSSRYHGEEGTADQRGRGAEVEEESRIEPARV
jgi:hypothetical protein